MTRHSYVVSSFIVSMVIGAFFLKMSGNTVSSAGAFSLSGYYSQNPVEKAINSYRMDSDVNWSRIETFTVFAGEAGFDRDCHFLIGNGTVGSDGQVIPTEFWTKQSTCNLSDSKEPVIWIGLVVDEIRSRANEVQSRRAELLAESLSRKYEIASDSISVPAF